jgi:hypothetical protein
MIHTSVDTFHESSEGKEETGKQKHYCERSDEAAKLARTNKANSSSARRKNSVVVSLLPRSILAYFL